MSGEVKMKTITLGSLAEICLGKVILKDDILTDGNARVASISNMTEQGLVYEGMEMTNVTAGDVAKYEIKNNDVLITCRGTKFRSVFVENKPPYLVIASGNLMILRCENAIDAEVIHLYLQSPQGEGKIMQQPQGINSINIGKKQLLSLEIPELSEEGKEKMVQLWNQGMKKYRNIIIEAGQEWNLVQEQVYGGFKGGIHAGSQGAVPDEFNVTMSQEKYSAPNINGKERKNIRKDRLLIELD